MDKLIAAVQARECLWDKSYRGHRNRFKLERYWNEVAAEVGTTSEYCRSAGGRPCCGVISCAVDAQATLALTTYNYFIFRFGASFVHYKRLTKESIEYKNDYISMVICLML